MKMRWVEVGVGVPSSDRTGVPESRGREVRDRRARAKGRLQGQGERPQEKPTLLAPRPWPSRLQSCENIVFLLFQPPSRGTLSWCPWETAAGFVRESVPPLCEEENKWNIILFCDKRWMQKALC